MSKKPNKPQVPRTFLEGVREVWVPYSQLLPYLKPYRWRFIAGLICGALAGVMSGGLGWVIKVVSDGAFGGGVGKTAIMHGAHAAGPGIQSVIWKCMMIPGFMILRGVCAYLAAYCMAWVGLKIVVDLRDALFRHVLSHSLDFFNKMKSGNLMSHVANDTRMAQQALTQVGADLIVQPITIVSALCFLLRMDWKFTLVSMTLFPLCLVPIQYYGKRARKSGRDEESQAGSLFVILSEAFAGIKLIKALAREDYEAAEFEEAGRQQFHNSLRVRKAIEIVGPMIEGVGALGAGLAIFYVYIAGMSVGTFIGLLTCTFMLYDPVKKLSKVHVNLQKCLASTTRIFELMALKPRIADAPTAHELTNCRGEIEFEGVSFSYIKNVPAVRKLDLHIAPGKNYALVGASGAGKSTVLSLLLRFYDPGAGIIRIDGHDLRQITQKSLRENIGIVTQDTFLFHESIFENIQYGRLDATKEEVYEAARQAFAHDFILAQQRGYETVIGDKGCMLSGGQQQRLAIARALLKNAPILLLDEATSALDSESEKQIQLALERLAAGRTVIAIAHRLSTILKADQIVVMEHGQVKEVGRHDELMDKSGHYRRLYDLQFQHHGSEPEALFEPMQTALI
ncbi:MAG: ATP-binding cassette, subfamily bacterial MsbA [Chthoniobacter sp.]|nr:ATP-binding cassette, subfamily bacterial MsbA [Chthoniobacter sp.]